MPVGYVITVAIVGWGVACALTRWRALGPFAGLPGLVVSELPFIVGYYLIASTVLALAEGALSSPVGAGAVVVAVLALVGLAVVVYRATQAHPALHNTDRPRWPWGRILRAPLFPIVGAVLRVSDRAYGDDRRQRLDVYHRRDRPDGVPVLIHIHGGGFSSGNKAREARPMIRYLTSRRGFVCVSIGYRLQPSVTLDDQLADVRSAIAWVRANVAHYGGDPATLFVTGSSAGAYLAIRVAADERFAGIICRYGYYGDLVPAPGAPRLLIIHGRNDVVAPVAWARAFADRARSVATAPVRYAELPGAHHDFDMFESIRAAAVSQAIEAFMGTSGGSSMEEPKD